MPEQQSNFDVDAALHSGVPEDQIYEYLVRTSPGFDADGAKQSGATQRQIIDYLAQKPSASPNPPTPPPAQPPAQPAHLPEPRKEHSATPPGAGQRFSSSFIDQVNPIPLVNTAGRIGKDLWNGQFREAGKEIYDATLAPSLGFAAKSEDARKQGNYLDYMNYSIGSTPVFGPPIGQGWEQIRSGDVAGGLGTWSGMVTGLLLPKVVGKAKGAIASKLHEQAPRVYREHLSFPKVTEQEHYSPGSGDATAQRAVKRGLGRQEIESAPPDRPVVQSKAGQRQLSDRITRTKTDQMARIKAATDLGIEFDLKDVTQPVKELVNKWKSYGDFEPAELIENRLQEWMERHYGGAGGGFEVSPSELQEMKRTFDDQIRSWSKETGDTTGGDRFRREMRTAFDRSLDTVGDVKSLNEAMHLDSILMKAIDEGLQKSNKLDKASLFMMFTGQELLWRGYLKSGSVLTAGAILKMAMNNPQTMSRLGIWLDKVGVKPPSTLPKLMTAGAMSVWAARQAQNAKRKGTIGSDSPPGVGKGIDPMIEKWWMR